MIFAIDPGTEQSGYVHYEPGKHAVLEAGVMDNDHLLQWIESSPWDGSVLAIEQIASMGMAVGETTFETCVWTGMFMHAWAQGWKTVERIKRNDVKLHLCGVARAKDPNVRMAILDLFPRTGGGKVPQVGTKKLPGPLFGVSSHAWSALAVAITVNHRMKHATTSTPRKRPASRRIALL